MQQRNMVVPKVPVHFPTSGVRPTLDISVHKDKFFAVNRSYVVNFPITIWYSFSGRADVLTSYSMTFSINFS